MIPLFCAVHVRSVEVLCPIPVLEFHTVHPRYSPGRCIAFLFLCNPFRSTTALSLAYVRLARTPPATHQHAFHGHHMPVSCCGTSRSTFHTHLCPPPPFEFSPPLLQRSRGSDPTTFESFQRLFGPRLCLGSSDPRTHVEPGQLPFKVRFERNP